MAARKALAKGRERRRYDSIYMRSLSAICENPTKQEREPTLVAEELRGAAGPDDSILRATDEASNDGRELAKRMAG